MLSSGAAAAQEEQGVSDDTGAMAEGDAADAADAEPASEPEGIDEDAADAEGQDSAGDVEKAA